MDNPDYFCVKCLAEGDEEAFVALYNKYFGKIYYSSLKMTQSETTAQDITQNVFLKIWNTRRQLDPKQNFAAYISVMCRNAIFDTFKKAALDETLKQELQQLAVADSGEPEDDFYEEYKKLLSEAIGKLPFQRRIVFERCKLQEQSYAEVALALGISRSTVQDHIVKANKTIREYLHNYGQVSFSILFLILSQLNM
jgi:RNA polymerase sigma-70 factor (ECF subfamily)